MEKQKRISKKQLYNFLNKNFHVAKTTGIGLEDVPDSYLSNIDDSYFTFVGLEEDIKFLLKRGITEQLQNSHNIKNHTVNIGFNPVEQKWYGWSHRAIYGFGIGSTCKKGDACFQPSNEEEFLEDCLSFWADVYSYESGDKKVETVIKDGNKYAFVSYTYNDKVPNKKLRGTQYKQYVPFPKEWGKGEWTAETLDDAKQMAIDFADDIA